MREEKKARCGRKGVSKKRRLTANAIALAVLLFSIAGIAFFIVDIKTADREVKELAKAEGSSLLKIHKKYPDIIGWIKVEGTNINYPVMRSDEYIKKNYKGESDVAGTPFVAEGWTFDCKSTLIYGHNMRYYGTMFAQLERFKKEVFFKEHKDIYFYALDEGSLKTERRHYKVCYAIKTDSAKWSYWLYANGNEQEVAEYIKECARRSLYTAEEIYAENVLTLSTCSYHIDRTRGRFLIVAILEDAEQER